MIDSARCVLFCGARMRYLVIVILLVAVVGVVQAANQGEPVATEVVSPRTFTMQTPKGPVVVQDLAVAGQVLVKLAPGTTLTAIEPALARHQGSVLRSIPRYNIHVISLAEGMSVNQGCALWAAEPGVEIAEPDRLCWPTRVPNDPRYSEQYQWQVTQAEDAWDFQRGSASTVIAIIDSGIQFSHPDLNSKIWVNEDEIAGNLIDDDENGYVDDVYGWDFVNNDNDPQPEPDGEDDDENGYPDDNAPHGTHVAGLAAATTDNAEGVAGHDWNAQLMSVQVFDDDGSTPTSLILDGLAYAVQNGADIINLSLAGGYTETWTDPITDAFDQGVVVVAGAGNFGVVYTDDEWTWFSPVCNDGEGAFDNHVLGVGITDENDEAIWWGHRDASSHNFVDVMAPGYEVLSTMLYAPAYGFNTYYERMSGTSMSCPVAAGLCGLVKAQFPSMQPAEIIEQIRNACDNIDDLNPPEYAGTMGMGRINSLNSLADMPPGPPRGVMAFDTPNDEGGSITVSWGKSVDDGRGANDVLGYKVFKAEDSEGPWTQIADLPAGSTNWVDELIPDLTPFYYKVAVYDAANTVESSPVGPVEARDDLPPDAVDTLTAGDTQADEGGSITLTWYGYIYPDDFVEYRIYRAQTPFTDVSGLTPLATVTDPDQQDYIDATTEDDTNYLYAVTAVDDYNNENKDVTAVGPVQSHPNFAFTYPAGLSMLAIGAQPYETDMAELTGIPPGELQLARWDPTAELYHLYSDNPNDPFLRQELGRAFWLRTPYPLLLNIAGAPAPGDFLDVPMAPGWNMIGNGFTEPLPMTHLSVVIGGTEYDLATSNQNRYTVDYGWAYDTTASSYRLVSATMPFGSTEVARGRGMFFLSNVSGYLRMQKPAGAAQLQSSVSGRLGLGDNGWSLRLVARAGDAADTDNFLGVTPQAESLNGLVSPPPAEPGVDLYFGEVDGPRRAADFVTALGSGHKWDINVACDLPGTEMELSWPDLSGLPNSLRPVLTDLQTGKSVYLRTATHYSFPSGEGVRKFTLAVSADGAGLLSVSTLSVLPTPAGGAEIAFTLSQDAEVSVEVLNIAGRSIRTVQAGRVSPAGANVVVWDGRNNAGSAAPPGSYVVRLRAVAENGQVVNALRRLNVAR